MTKVLLLQYPLPCFLQSPILTPVWQNLTRAVRCQHMSLGVCAACLWYSTVM